MSADRHAPSGSLLVVVINLYNTVGTARSSTTATHHVENHWP